MAPNVGQPESSAGDVIQLLVARYDTLAATATTGFFDRRSKSFTTESSRSFLLRAAGVAQGLRAETEPGEQILIAAGSPEASWLGFVGAVLAETVPVLLPIRPAFDAEWLTQSRLRDAHEALPDAHLLVQVNTAGEPCVAPTRPDWLPLDLETAPADTLPASTRRPDLDRPHHLQFTSGSTGALKAVVMTHGNVLAQAAALRERIDLTPDDHMVSWLPLYHDMGLVGIALDALLNGAHLRLMTPFDFLSDPSHWLRAVSEAPAAITAAPNFAFEYTTRRVSDERMAGIDLRTVGSGNLGATNTFRALGAKVAVPVLLLDILKGVHRKDTSAIRSN